MVSNLLMFMSFMCTRASDHRCDTARDFASGLSALAGRIAEKPPTMGSSCVMWPPTARTSRSAVSLDGLASRTITLTCPSGFLVVSDTSPGSAMR